MHFLAWIAPLFALALATPVKDPYPYTSDISPLTKLTPYIYQCHPRINATYTVIFPKSLLPRWIDCKTLCGDKLTLYDPKTRRHISATIIGFDQHEKDGDLIVNEAVWRYFGGNTCKIDWGFCEDDKDDHKPQKPHSTPVPRPHTPVKPTHPASHPPQKSPATPWVPPRQPSGTPHPSQPSPHPSQAPRV